MFSTLSKTNFYFSVTYILSSANAFNLDQSKILLFSNGFNPLNNVTGYNVKHKDWLQWSIHFKSRLLQIYNMD